MPDRTPSTWYTAVSGCVRCGHDATAVELPRGMPERTTVGLGISGGGGCRKQEHSEATCTSGKLLCSSHRY
uniref:Uncharacterized protein n=1 Tax=Oryza rufipogon TaxID=4529 RepID=A0A0E0RBV8_ORYRU